MTSRATVGRFFLALDVQRIGFKVSPRVFKVSGSVQRKSTCQKKTVLPQGFLSGIKSKAFMTDFLSCEKMLEAEMTQMKVAAKFKWNEFQK